MDPIVLDNIPFSPTFDQAAAETHIRQGSKQADMLISLLQEAREIARPKALYKVCSIAEKGEETVTLDGIPFHSRVLRVNLDSLHRVFPYLATCGRELETWQNAQDDMLVNYYAGVINELALSAAREYLQIHLEETYALGETSYMSPGSLADWPITGQRSIFKVLGDPQRLIGVKLQPSLMMTPVQSVSGIRFPSEESFQSCQLCPIEDCSHRKAAYDPDLLERKFS